MAYPLGSAILDLDGDNSKLQNKMNQTEQETKSWLGKLGSFFSKSLSVATGMGFYDLAKNTMSLLKEQLVDVVQAGMEMESLGDAYEYNANKIGVSSKGMLQALSEATAGMVDNASLMKQFNLAYSLVGESFAKDLPNMMTGLRKISAATGQDMTYLTDSLVRGIGRLSPMIIDNLGLQVSLTEAYEAWAKANHVEVDEMTKSQQQAAYTAAVMKKLNEVTADMPDVVGSAKQQWEALKTTFSNFKTELGEKLIPYLTPLLSKLLEIAQKALPILIDGFDNKLIPALQTVWSFIQTNILPILDSVKSYLIGTFGGSISTVSKFINGLLLPALSDLYGFFLSNILPVVKTVAALFATYLPIAVSTLTAYWNNVLLPSLQNFWAFISEYILPIFSDLISFLSQYIPGAVAFLTSVWDNLLYPALLLIWNIFNNVLLPVLRVVAVVVRSVLGVALNVLGSIIETLAMVWTDVLVPALQAFWNFANTVIVPLLQDLAYFFGSVVAPAVEKVANFIGNVLLGAFNAIRNVIQWVIDKIEGFKNALSSVKDALPDWLTPGSPTPLENGITGLNNALANLGATGLVPLQTVLSVLKEIYTIVNTLLPAGLILLQTAWGTYFIPILTTVMNFLLTQFMPVFTEMNQFLYESVITTVYALVEAFGTWLISLTSLFDFVDASLYPKLLVLSILIGGSLSANLSGATVKTYQLRTAMEQLEKKVKDVAKAVASLASALASLKIPHDLTPGSPTPFEIGLTGVEKAMKRIVNVPLKQALDYSNVTMPFVGDLVTGTAKPSKYTTNNMTFEFKDTTLDESQLMAIMNKHEELYGTG